MIESCTYIFRVLSIFEKRCMISKAAPGSAHQARVLPFEKNWVCFCEFWLHITCIYLIVVNMQCLQHVFYSLLSVQIYVWWGFYLAEAAPPGFEIPDPPPDNFKLYLLFIWPKNQVAHRLNHAFKWGICWHTGKSLFNMIIPDFFLRWHISGMIFSFT